MRNTVFDKLALALVLGLAALCSCQKPYAFDRPLGLTSRQIKLSQYEGSTHIIVYSSGAWTCSLREQTGWASLEVVDAGTVGDMLFTYTLNEGINRKVTIDLSCDQTRDSIVIVQSGTNSNPQLSFVDEIVNAGAEAGTVQVRLASNVMNSLDQLYPSVVYYSYGEPGPMAQIDGTGWISACRIADNVAYLDLTSNTSGEKRTADFFLRLNNGMDIDFTISIRIRQNSL